MSGAIIALLRGGASAPVTTHSYQWQSSPNGTTGWTNITGQTNSTFIPDSSLLGLYVACLDTATDDSGSTSVRSNVLGPIVTTPPIPGPYGSGAFDAQLGRAVWTDAGLGAVADADAALGAITISEGGG